MKRSEMDLDAMLSALAREADEATPHPGPELTAGVLADAALSVLAREAAEAAPRPGAELVSRVLADAAEVSAARAAMRPARQPAAARRRSGPAAAGASLMNLLFGWRAGAVAAMALALAVGLGIGFEMEPGTLPILDRGSDGAAAVTLASLEGDLMDVDGL